MSLWDRHHHFIHCIPSCGGTVHPRVRTFLGAGDGRRDNRSIANLDSITKSPASGFLDWLSQLPRTLASQKASISRHWSLRVKPALPLIIINQVPGNIGRREESKLGVLLNTSLVSMRFHGFKPAMKSAASVDASMDYVVGSKEERKRHW